MENSYRIYFNEKTLFIVPGDNELLELIDGTGAKKLTNPNKAEIAAVINELDTQELQQAIIESTDPEATFKLFCGEFKVIQAGGGLVANVNGEYLFIFRRGKWDLPKGKLDKGETIAECAVREVKEETGLQDVILKEHLLNTYHAYHDRGKFCLKESVWYTMQSNGNEALVPQAEEDITDIEWLSPNRWNEVLTNTFPSIIEVLEASGKMI